MAAISSIDGACYAAGEAKAAVHHSLGPLTLAGAGVRLEPLAPGHAPALLEAGRDSEVWRHLTAEPRDLSQMESFVMTALAAQARGLELPFAVIALPEDKVVGSTRYLNIWEEHRQVEIGWTWYASDRWGSGVNPEAKLLLLRHAFEDWGANRVYFKTDVLNVRSRAAIEKLGAVYEGTLRSDRVRRDGSLRDTVVYSLIRGEWPATKAALEARLSSPPRSL
jgi:RimJ/RimL family protein N-acetyltransferase